MIEKDINESWTKINTELLVNGGLFIKKGTSIDLVTTTSNPITTTKGIKIMRATFFNVYPTIKTYVRATEGTATILIDETFLNYNKKNKKSDSTTIRYTII